MMRLSGYLVAWALVFGSLPVRAADPPPSSIGPAERKAVADRLFDEAHTALEADDWDVACGKFRASMRYDTSVSTLLNIARCHEHDGELLDAWRTYNRARLLNRETPDAARRASLAGYMEKAAAAVEARLARLRVVVAHPPDGLTIASDGVPWTEGLAGEPQPLDPREHTITVGAPGYQTVERRVTLQEGVTNELLITLEEAPDEPALAAPLEAPAPDPETSSGAPPSPPERPSAAPPVWIWPVGVAGLAAIGVSIGLGVHAAGARSELGDECTDLGDAFGCPDDRYSQADVDALQARANTAGPAVGVGIAGVGLLAAGVVGLVVGTSGADDVAVSIGPWGMDVTGRF